MGATRSGTKSGSGPANRHALTDAQIARLRTRLEAEREVIAARVAGRRRALAQPALRSPDDADWAADSADQSLLARLADRDAKLLHEIERALAKMDAGTYGVCEASGEPIGFARLWTRPWTRHAVAVKEERERQRVRGGGAIVLGEGDAPDDDRAA
jgi:DnaK suppressor protein